MEVNRWVLALPIASYIFACWLFMETEIEARVQFSRAKEEWRQEEYEASIRSFLALSEKYPRSKFAVDALWEMATVYYYNLYDVSNALYYFDKIIQAYPNSDLAAKSHLKLAEIFDLELNEIPKALEHLNKALSLNPSDTQRREISFKVADANFRLSDFDLALSGFEQIIAEDEESHLSQQASNRVGAILQIGKDYEQAIETYQHVLERTSCDDCRLQAQLGMIESYELLDQLTAAIHTAEAIDSRYYPSDMKNRLLERLVEKRKYYEPGSWTGR